MKSAPSNQPPTHAELAAPAWRRVARTITALTCLAAVGFSTGGCAKTRFGALIPGDVRSEKTKGELVTARYIQIKPLGSASRGTPRLPA